VKKLGKGQGVAYHDGEDLCVLKFFSALFLTLWDLDIISDNARRLEEAV